VNDNENKENIMKLSAPKKITFYITLLIFVLGIAAWALKQPLLGVAGVAIAYAVLFIANLVKGM
jgi:hypothetical protein